MAKCPALKWCCCGIGDTNPVCNITECCQKSFKISAPFGIVVTQLQPSPSLGTTSTTSGTLATDTTTPGPAGVSCPQNSIVAPVVGSILGTAVIACAVAAFLLYTKVKSLKHEVESLRSQGEGVAASQSQGKYINATPQEIDGRAYYTELS